MDVNWTLLILNLSDEKLNRRKIKSLLTEYAHEWVIGCCYKEKKTNFIHTSPKKKKTITKYIFSWQLRGTQRSRIHKGQNNLLNSTSKQKNNHYHLGNKSNWQFLCIYNYKQSLEFTKNTGQILRLPFEKAKQQQTLTN